MKKSLILGFFDGVHVAHQAVINSALGNYSVLITFEKSPKSYFTNNTEYILSRKNSLQKILSLGVKEVIELNFADIVNLNAEEYLRKIVEQYSPVSISTGFNHTFGANKSGNADFLFQNQEKYGYKYFCIPPQKDGDEIISSTLIRNCIKQGDVVRANRLLNSQFILEGEVIYGTQVAGKMGYPTANLIYPENIVKLPYGVYSARVDNKAAILNWGIKPTFNSEQKPILEVHILNFKGNLYGKNIRIKVLKKIRNEKKFTGIEELKAQIEKDIKNA